VFQAQHIITDEVVAIKVFLDSKSETIHAACAEFVCAMRSAGPSALQYHELAFLKGKPALVMELGEQCLDKWIRCHAFPGSNAPSRKSSAGNASRGRSRSRKSSSAASSCSSWGSEPTPEASPAPSQFTSRSASVDSTNRTSVPSVRSEWQLGAVASPTQLDIMNIMLGTLEGLMTMHAAGLAHLDLKPGNVIMTDSSTAKVADFGAACAIDLTRGVQVDSLVESMEHKLGVNMAHLSSSYAPGEASAQAVAKAAVDVVRTSVLPTMSCPGAVQDADTERSLSLQELTFGSVKRTTAGSCQGGALPCPAPRAEGGVRFVSAARCSAQGGAEQPPPKVARRPPAASVSGAYSRQPAYSLREVPMVRQCWLFLDLNRLSSLQRRAAVCIAQAVLSHGSNA
jgi:Protein kinase domain